MRPGIITRYNASAGSGKTYVLAGIYLEALFSDPKSYRNILAVTFTNKATAEMKERILHNLYLLAIGKKSEYYELIRETTGKGPESIRKEASGILDQLLHDYSRFSVGTIDSFFQKVLRSFARESGLQAGFNIILDHSAILMEAVDGMLHEAETDRNLLQWLIEFGHREILGGKSWNLKNKILSLAGEIFKERYRILSENGYIVEDRDQLREAIKEINDFRNSFKNSISRLAREAIDILNRNNVEQDMLYQKSRSIRKFLSDAIGDIPQGSLNTLNAATDEGRYASGKLPSPELQAALEQGLDKKVEAVAKEYKANIRLYRSAELLLGNLYALGILNDIAAKMRVLLNEQNKFLLSDAGDILRRIIASEQAPFIYEKAGNRYKNFMIDEFQDTSRVQWHNFLPLINNSIAEGEDSLVVGDIKQSIYRWRNSDWEIFHRIGESFHPESFRSRVLQNNWRSSANIIAFNNTVFSLLPSRLENELNLDNDMLTKVYRDVVQEDPGKFTDGYVRMKMYDSEDEGKQEALDDLPGIIEEIQDKGYEAGDIGILVRTKDEGQEVINRITDYASKTTGNTGSYSYRIISQDSLLLGSSPVVVFLVSVLKYLIDKDDRINHSVMVQHYLLAKNHDEIERPLFLDSMDEAVLSSGHSGEFNDFLDKIRYLSVYEITDRLIAYTGLDKSDAAKPYLTTLQNCILEFAGTETNDIPAFLHWWENEGSKRSVSSAGQSDAMQLMTIHKSKGLQFRVVLLPFISWTFKHEIPPVLWIYSDNTLLKKLGAVPVKMKKEFTETHFRDFYFDELGRAAVDKLNMLYVAFTRARECLYGNLLLGKKGKSAGAYLFDIFSEQHEALPVNMKKYWDQETTTLRFGKVPAQEGKKDKKAAEILIGYPLVINDSRLSLKLHNKSFFTSEREKGGGKRYYGLLMHEILASVRTADDAMQALEYYMRKGVIVYDEYLVIKKKIFDALQDEPVRSWFSDDVKVRNEKDILVPGGAVKRPDRIIFKANRIIIVDFKFGNILPGHKLQVKEYKNLLTDMAYDNVEAFLWYPELSQVVAV